ncbi:MAG: TIGR04282 family arsenosugar biosynthesis glycosyltransferase [Lacipirellulaceae bacterium]
MRKDYANCCLGLFAKHWTPGKVKTRLGALVGMERAAHQYRCFVETTIARLNGLPIDKTLVYTPGHERLVFEEISSGWQLLYQGEGDLGVRMRRFFHEHLTANYHRIILLGTDSPNVPLDYIEQAFELLKEHDAVFGPTEDGGYYLIGLSRPADRLFESIPWSTGEVWSVTQSRLKEEGIPFATVPSWYDVDTESDFNRLRDDLRHSEESELRELSSKL